MKCFVVIKCIKELTCVVFQNNKKVQYSENNRFQDSVIRIVRENKNYLVVIESKDKFMQLKENCKVNQRGMLNWLNPLCFLNEQLKFHKQKKLQDFGKQNKKQSIAEQLFEFISQKQQNLDIYFYDFINNKLNVSFQKEFIDKNKQKVNSFDQTLSFYRIRGIPYRILEKELAENLGIPKENLAIWYQNGRNSGSAIAAIKNQQRKSFLEKDRKYIGQRYIEVYIFQQIIKVTQTQWKKACKSLNKVKGDGLKVKLCGLPFDVQKQQIVQFLDDVQVKRQDVDLIFIKKKFTGNAFVYLQKEWQVKKALAHNKRQIGNRYIQIYQIQ